MKPKMWVLLEECIEEGARGFLWNDLERVPTEQVDIDFLAEKIVNRVMASIDERFTFDDEIRG